MSESHSETQQPNADDFENAVDNDSGVGALLQASRLRIGEDIREVADVLRIRYRYLEDIEAGRFSSLPGTTYAIGFIRTYADHLGLDGEEVVRRFKEEVAASKGDENLEFPAPIGEAGIPAGAVIFVGLIIAVLAYGAWYASTTEKGFIAELISPIPERLAKILPEDEKAAVEPTPKLEPAKPMEPTEASGTKSDEAKPETEADQTLASAVSALSNSPSESDEKEKVESPASGMTTDTVSDAAEGQAAKKKPDGMMPNQSASSEAAPEAPTMADRVVAKKEDIKKEMAEVAPTPEPQIESQKKIVEKKVEKTAPVKLPEVKKPVLKVEEKKPVVEVVQPTPTPAPEPVATPAPETASPEATLPEATPQVATNTPSSDSPSKGRVYGVENKDARIVVRAKKNSWIQVRDDVANKLLLTRLLRQGDSYRVPNRDGLKLLAGNAGALEILVDGKAVPAIGPQGAVRRSVSLDAKRLVEGKAVIE